MILNILNKLLILIIVYSVIAIFIFDDIFLGYQGKYRNLKTYLPVSGNLV